MTVHELIKKISNKIQNKMFLPNHFKENFGDYEKCLTSLDLIEDCQDAIDEFIATPEFKNPKRSVLNIYGVLQATYCQQDGLFGLFQKISRKSFKNISDFFNSFNFNIENRNIRNDIVGHPTTRKGDKEFYFLNKGSNTKYKFSYGGYTNEFIIKEVDLKKIIEEQNNLTQSVLIELIEIVNKKTIQHIEKHKSISLYSIVFELNSSIQWIKRGYSDEIRGFQAESGIKEVVLKIRNVESELSNRFQKGTPQNLLDTISNIKFILERLQYWYDRKELLNNKDAEIFMIAFDKEFDELADMFKEIDNEYN